MLAKEISQVDMPSFVRNWAFQSCNYLQEKHLTPSVSQFHSLVVIEDRSSQESAVLSSSDSASKGGYPFLERFSSRFL